jgi:hypothetical protein
LLRLAFDDDVSALGIAAILHSAANGIEFSRMAGGRLDAGNADPPDFRSRLCERIEWSSEHPRTKREEQLAAVVH